MRKACTRKSVDSCWTCQPSPVPTSYPAGLLNPPHNFLAYREGLKNLGFAGNFVRPPSTGIVTMRETLERSPEQFRGLSHREIPQFSQAMASLTLPWLLHARGSGGRMRSAEDEFQDLIDEFEDDPANIFHLNHNIDPGDTQETQRQDHHPKNESAFLDAESEPGRPDSPQAARQTASFPAQQDRDNDRGCPTQRDPNAVYGSEVGKDLARQGHNRPPYYGRAQKRSPCRKQWRLRRGPLAEDHDEEDGPSGHRKEDQHLALHHTGRLECGERRDRLKVWEMFSTARSTLCSSGSWPRHR